MGLLGGEKLETEVILPTANGGAIRHEDRAPLRPYRGATWIYRQSGLTQLLGTMAVWYRKAHLQYGLV